jgi:hypothetical protein
LGGVFGGGGKKQAKAIEKASKAEAKAAREAARGAQLATETMLAQDRASRAAAELLKRPQGQIEVQLDTDGGGDTFDPATGKRRTTRSGYTSAIQI